MTAIWNFIVAHQVICTLTAGFIWSSFISALPAPGANSGAWYNFWFKFLNVLAANIARAQNAKVESSPNFQAAIDVQTKQAGLPQMDVQPVAPKP